MIKKSITLKLFFILLILLISFTLAAVGFQAHYFSSYYQQGLDETLKTNMKAFARDYAYADKLTAKDNLLNSFIQGNTAMAAVVDGKGQIILGYDFKMLVQTHDGLLINIPIENLTTLREIQSLEIITHDELYVEGIYDRLHGDMTYISSLSKNGKRAFTDASNTVSPPVMNARNQSEKSISKERFIPMSFKGLVVATTFPSLNVVGLGSRKDVLSEALQRIDTSIYEKSLQQNTFSEMLYQSLLTGNTYNTFVLPISPHHGGEFLVAMTPRKPISEISGMMVPFYKVVTLSSLLAAVLIAVVFSIFITKPLVRLNQAAVRLSQLDFDAAIESRTEDEIGSLSRSLNSLAFNLKQHMTDLNISHMHLQHELDKERLLDQTRRDFVSSVSHELKTPLAIIRSYAEGIQDHLNPDKTEHYVAVILDEVHRMDRLVMDMLDLFRLDNAVLSPQNDCFDVLKMSEDMLLKFHHETDRKQLCCRLLCDTPTALVLGNPARIQQVLMNFMSNGIRHALPGTLIELRITTVSTKVGDNDHYLIEIQNDGPQIPEDKLPLVWDRFYRVDDDRGRLSGGTGLGLSIVKSILDSHQSTYGIKNHASGVTAFFTLANVK